LFTVIAGISSIAHAQDERSGSSVDIDDGNLHQDQHRFLSLVEGSWIFNIEDVNQRTTFHSFVSLAAGGVVVTSASLPTPSPFYGTWRQTGPNSFKVIFYTFVPDATGKLAATINVSLTLELTSRNTSTGTGVGHNCDLEGENCTPGDDFQFTGKRILAE
jgi:hypothetical protein